MKSVVYSDQKSDNNQLTEVYQKQVAFILILR